MFSKLITLVRGRSEDAAQSFLDANAIPLLRQQMRDAARIVEKSRKSVAVIMAYAEREKVSLQSINDKISDLETRVTEAISKGKDEFALEGATAIAELEAERTATEKTIETYKVQIKRLRADLSQSEALLAELKRGQRLAEANHRTTKIGAGIVTPETNGLAQAKETLERLQQQQDHTDSTLKAMTELSVAASSEDIVERMASAGIGEKTKTTAEEVLERLTKNKKKSAA
ncbi:MAG: PspA/IM30 family protein [Pseudomonadota bacterium]